MKNTKNAFTLVEVMVSITLLGILFGYLFEITNTTKKLNKPYLDKSKKIVKESLVFKTLVRDFSQVDGGIDIEYGKKYDIARFKTKNSIYGIISPYVTYLVSKKELTLIRTESLQKYDLSKTDDITNKFIYGDILVSDTISFKVHQNKDFYSIMLRAKEFNPMVVKLPKIK